MRSWTHCGGPFATAARVGRGGGHAAVAGAGRAIGAQLVDPRAADVLVVQPDWGRPGKWLAYYGEAAMVQVEHRSSRATNRVLHFEQPASTLVRRPPEDVRLSLDLYQGWVEGQGETVGDAARAVTLGMGRRR